MIRCGAEVLQELSYQSMQYRISIGGQIETNRVITSKGTVIRYLSNNKIQILFANGNISEYDNE